MSRATAYLGLGSNLGNRERNLRKALQLLSDFVRIEQVSSIYETKPVGYADQGPFLNAVAEISTDLSPYEILVKSKEIETTLGRAASFRNGPRCIDIDILLCGGCVISTPQLVVPHPRLLERAFVLIPLAEIAPQVSHPVTGETIEEAMRHVGLAGVREWKGASKDV